MKLGVRVGKQEKFVYSLRKNITRGALAVFLTFYPNTSPLNTISDNKYGSEGYHELKIQENMGPSGDIDSETKIIKQKNIKIIKPVYYSQHDPKWTNKKYSIIKGDGWKTANNGKPQTIGTSGCGVAAAAMVVSTMTAKQITPDIVADYAMTHRDENGSYFRTYNNGTSDKLFPALADEYGLDCINTKDTNQVTDALKNDKNCVVVALMKWGHFTGRNGHYLVLTDVLKEDGNEKFIIYDCNISNPYYNRYRDGAVKKTDKAGIVKASISLVDKENYKSVGYYIFKLK